MPNFVIGMLAILFCRVSGLVADGRLGRLSTCLVQNYFCSDWILPVIAYALAHHDHRALHTLQCYRAHALRLRAHPRAKGLNSDQSDDPPRAAQHAAATGHDCRPDNSRPVDWQHLHQFDLPHSWAGQILCHQHLQPRLSDGDGHDLVGRCALGYHLSVD